MYVICADIYIEVVYFNYTVELDNFVLFFISTTVMSEPDDITTCIGERAVFTCVLNTTDSNITNNDVQWYRFIKSNSTTVMVDQHGESINFITHTTGNTINSTLIITNTRTSYNGSFWVGTRSSGVCNASLTVLVVETSTYVNSI